VVERDETAELAVDMIIWTQDDDKNLVTCKVVQWVWEYAVGTIIVTGRYSLYKLIYKWDNYFFLEEWDVLWIIENDCQ
jgi:hypothetical protein